MQKELLRSLAKENASEECQMVIRALPIHPRPTIEQMVEVCTEVVTAKPPIQTPIPRKTVDVVASQGSDKNKRKCFNCGSPDHFAKECPKLKRSNPSSKLVITGPSLCDCQHRHGNQQ